MTKIPHKTAPTRQYDIFLIKGENPAPPPGSHLLTTYDEGAGGHWAIQYGALSSQFEGITPQMGSASSPSWNDSGL
jgi:hypothetical protein